MLLSLLLQEQHRDAAVYWNFALEGAAKLAIVPQPSTRQHKVSATAGASECCKKVVFGRMGAHRVFQVCMIRPCFFRNPTFNTFTATRATSGSLFLSESADTRL